MCNWKIALCTVCNSIYYTKSDIKKNRNMQYQGQLLKYWNKLFVHVQAKIIKSVSHSM